jgi:hypothetical protein
MEPIGGHNSIACAIADTIATAIGYHIAIGAKRAQKAIKSDRFGEKKRKNIDKNEAIFSDF